MSTSIFTELHESYYTFAETAQALGLSKPWLRHLISQGALTTHRIGREVLLEQAEVKRLAEERGVFVQPDDFMGRSD